MILYLHGFRSSPRSFKARLLGERLQALGHGNDYHCPQLPASPRKAIELIAELIKPFLPEDINLVGSSLGGYYATWLAEQHGCKAVLLNPAIKPPRDLEKYVGISRQYHSDAPFEFKHDYIGELQALSVKQITRAERYFLIAATGDEVLDWREMVAFYPQARQRIIAGSDHGLSDFANYMDEVLAFCGIDCGERR